MPPKRTSGSAGGGSPSKASHAARAAALLSKARAQASSSPAAHARSSTTPSPAKPATLISSPKTPSRASSSSSEATMPLADLLKTLSSKGGLPMRDAMAIAGKLINARANTLSALAHISLIMLQDIGIESEEHRKRTVLAFKGKKAAGVISSSPSSGASGSAGPSAVGLAPDFGAYRKRRRDDDETLSREYGNVAAPSDERPGSSRRPKLEVQYTFNEVLEDSLLRGRYAVVNRAPVMTAWATILLERLNFSRPEALSLAHCYVNYTSTMRGISLGIIPAAEKERSVHIVGPNQPHFDLMGVKIPVMQMQDGSYRAISAGEVVQPDKAFHYMRRSMAQTLSSVMGALTLLADSFMEPSPQQELADSDIKEEEETEKTPEYGADYLNSRGYELYAEFRPSTSGEWGKKGRLWYDKILAMRRGHEAEMDEWKIKEARLEHDGPPEEDWSEDVERLVQQETEQEQQQRQQQEAFKQEPVQVIEVKDDVAI